MGEARGSEAGQGRGAPSFNRVGTSPRARPKATAPDGATAWKVSLTPALGVAVRRD
jgi:hypothetical protein